MTRDPHHISYFPLGPSTINVSDLWVSVPEKIMENDQGKLCAAKNQTAGLHH